MQLVPGAATVAEVMRNPRAVGYVLGIASNFDSRLRTICRDHPPLHECRQIFVSSEIGYPKPELQYYRSVEERDRKSVV